jgi:hypothetical protein
MSDIAAAVRGPYILEFSVSQPRKTKVALSLPRIKGVLGEAKKLLAGHLAKLNETLLLLEDRALLPNEIRASIICVNNIGEQRVIRVFPDHEKPVTKLPKWMLSVNKVKSAENGIIPEKD